MASNFSSLRSSRQNALAKLNEEITKEQAKQGAADARFWKLTVDAKTKLGFAKLRFLPAPVNEEVPWVRKFRHAFKHNGAWLIENCPTSIGRECPICKENNRLWNSGIEADKDVARNRKRQLKFVSNILVVQDPAHPENDGKVFLFEYGKKIHDKIQELMNPKFPDQQPTNPFDFWSGADFKLKSVAQGDFQNYDKSEFSDATELFAGDDEKKEEIWKQEHGLGQFTAEDQFKSFDEIEKRLNKVLTGQSAATAEEAIKREQPTPKDAQQAAEAVNAKSVKSTKKVKPVVVEEEPAGDIPENEDDIKNFFAGVLN